MIFHEILTPDYSTLMRPDYLKHETIVHGCHSTGNWQSAYVQVLANPCSVAFSWFIWAEVYKLLRWVVDKK